MADRELLGAAERALTGLNGAATRVSVTDRHNMFAPLTEFCWWVISADEALDRALTSQVYRPVRGADPDGRVVAGLRHVRNALGHDRLIATYTEGGLSFPFTFPISLGPIYVRWLPTSDVAGGHPKNRAAYELSVAERLVDETLYEARRWLERAHAWARSGSLPE